MLAQRLAGDGAYCRGQVSRSRSGDIGEAKGMFGRDKIENEKSRRLEALSAAIRANDEMLVGWLTTKFADSETAKDIAQDVYLRLWRFGQENQIDHPKALIFKTAANLAANEFYARRRRGGQMRSAGPDEEDPIMRVASDDPSPERMASARQDAEVSLRAIEALPEKIRRAFVLSRFEEKTYSEIATVLSVSVSSVEKYIIEALKSLRMALDENQKPQKKVVLFPGNKLGSQTDRKSRGL